MSDEFESEFDAKKAREEHNEKVQEFFRKFKKHGFACGLEIATLAKKMHKDALFVVPLYRSALVFPKPELGEHGECELYTMYMYGDPHAMGRDITEENLKDSMFEIPISFFGQRFGPDVFMHGSKVVYGDCELENAYWNFMYGGDKSNLRLPFPTGEDDDEEGS